MNPKEDNNFETLLDGIMRYRESGKTAVVCGDAEITYRQLICDAVIIACGGGIVKRKANYNLIKQNSQVIWIKRDLDKLETEGRPISLSRPLQEINDERKDAYEQWSDYFIDNNQDRD